MEGRLSAVWSATPCVSGGKHIISEVALELKKVQPRATLVNDGLRCLIAWAWALLSMETQLMAEPGTHSLLNYNNGGEKEAYSMSAYYGTAP